MKWIQRPPGTPLPSSPSSDYHGCLDALIATIRDMRQTRAAFRWIYENDDTLSEPAARFLTEDIKRAQERAAICAGMLFDRWIEVQQACDCCLDRVAGGEQRAAYRHENWNDPSQYF